MSGGFSAGFQSQEKKILKNKFYTEIAFKIFKNLFTFIKNMMSIPLNYTLHKI